MIATRGDDVFVCYSCAEYHPCSNEQNYLDKVAAHQAKGCTSFSRFNRDWLHEQHRSPLAVAAPRKRLVIGFGPIGSLIARFRVRDPRAAEALYRLRLFLIARLPQLEAVIHRLSFEELIPFVTVAAKANADVKQALQAVQTLTVTNLQSLASSATAGWQSVEIDNTSNLYLNSTVQAVLTTANTAPDNSKGMYVFAGSGIETGKLSNNLSGSEGTWTSVDVTANPINPRQLGFMPYNTAQETVESSAMMLAPIFGGTHPMFWAVAIINHSAAALSTGCTCKYRGDYVTVI